MKKFIKELNAIFTIMMRDIITAVLSPGMLALSLLMPLLMMGMLGRKFSTEYGRRIKF